jgi:hypothetical protein
MRQISCRYVDQIEEDSLEKWILDLDRRGKAPTYSLVQEMANILLAQRSTTTTITVGQNWVYKFVKRRENLRVRFYVDTLRSALYLRIRSLLASGLINIVVLLLNIASTTIISTVLMKLDS